MPSHSHSRAPSRSDVEDAEREAVISLPGEERRQLSAGEASTAVVHLYRAQVNKAVAWRKRLDTTTNWAVVTTAAAISFALGGVESQRHVVILLTSVLVSFFLLLEARRYRHYDIWQTRVHLLESEFYASILDPEGVPPDPDWRELLAADLRWPHYHISFAEALGWRLRRNYVWIYAAHLLTWFAKVAIHPTPISSLDHFFARAALGPFPGWAMVLFGLLFNGTLIVIALLTSRLRTTASEIVIPHERIKTLVPDIDESYRPFEEV